MRRRLALGAAAITVTVVVAFLVPLAVAVQVLASQRAVRSAELESQSLAAVLATVEDQPSVARIVADIAARDVNPVTVFLPGDAVVGTPAAGGDALALARLGRAFTVSVPGGRAVFVPVRGPSGATTVIRVLAPASQLRKGVARAWLELGAVGAALVILALVLADRMALAVVGPMRHLADTAGRLERGDLHARADPAGPREVATVGHALNSLAGRIGELLAAEREGVADISHRLRTPLTVLRLDIEALPEGVDTERLVADIVELEAAVGRVITEARQPTVAATSSDLAAATRNLLAFWTALARSQQRTCAVDVPDGPVWVAVPPADLDAVLDALVTNVFAHTPEGTAFRVMVTATADRARLVVEDDGPGWPAGFRLARGRSGKGSTGLGLDIARRTAERSGGTFAVEPSTRGGARVVLELALARLSA